MPITCDRTAQRHYEKDGTRCYSVSQVCELLTGGQRYGSQEAMDRGTHLHRLFALSVAAYAGMCAPPTIPADYAGYAASWQQWIEIAKPEPIDIEGQRVSRLKGLPYAGTFDLLCRMHEHGPRRTVLVDLKSGQKATWHRIQVQAYGKLVPDAERMALLYIDKDGGLPTWQIVKPDVGDWALFQHGLNVLIGRERL